MRRRFLWSLWLVSGAVGLLSCIAPPEQPGEAQPYALVVWSQAIHLLALDTQTVDPRVRIQEIRVPPGPHSLRFAYAGSSPRHTGQQVVPFPLDTQAGHQYVFEPKTCGIIWRPAVAEHVLIPRYCTTHTCTETETRVPPKIPRTPKCNTD
jgi:hypothetical protein